MKNSKNKKLIYWMTSGVAAVFILGVVIIGTNTLSHPNVQDLNYKIADSSQNNKENIKVDLQINKLKEIGSAKFDAREENINAEKIPTEFKFIENLTIPKEIKLTEIYKLYTRSNPDIKKYDKLHDYVFSYKKDDEHSIRIALSTVAEPIRDYHLGDNDKTSKIGDLTLKISQYEGTYMATFRLKNIYFDIETNGISESELVELIQSIITKSNT